MPNIAIQKNLSNDYELLEAIKVLRTNILFSGTNVKTIALTSCYENEGKSTLALNLACSIAQSGRKTILLDADMAKSVLFQRLTEGTETDGKVSGLSHYLSGMVSVDDILFKTDIPGLCIVFAGMLVGNSDTLLDSDEFKILLQALKKSFDYIIIDTPPLGQMVDCAVIAPIVDRVALVIDVSSNSYIAAKRVKKQLDNVGAKFAGVILNKVNFKESNPYYSRYAKYGKYYGKRYGRYGYGYGRYGYGYGRYGYGYGANMPKASDSSKDKE